MTNSTRASTPLLATCAELKTLLEKATPGPYYIASDDAEDTLHHRRSGLALIDTGRSADWPVLRLGEWPTTEYIAALLNAAPALLEAARQNERRGELLRRAYGWIRLDPKCPELCEDIAKELP